MNEFDELLERQRIQCALEYAELLAGDSRSLNDIKQTIEYETIINAEL